MCYSVDLRIWVLDFIENGGTISKTVKIYQVSRATIYRWRNRENIKPTKVKRRKRKLNWEALKKMLKKIQKQLYYKEQKNLVSYNAIFYALKQMKITRKK